MSTLNTQCPYCGGTFEVGAEFMGRVADCPNCDKKFVIQPITTPVLRAVENATPAPDNEKLIYILLAIFCGGIGVHNFYSGYWQRGVVKFCLTALGFLAPIDWGINAIWIVAEIVTAPPKEPEKGIDYSALGALFAGLFLAGLWVR